MEDKYTTKVKGHMTVEAIKDNIVVDSWEDANMIMSNARLNMTKIIAGMSGGNYINKVVIGTEGHVDGDILTPKAYTETRTELFSEEADDAYSFHINFENTTGANGVSTTITPVPDTYYSGDCTIDIQQLETDITYVIEVPESAGNGDGVAVYTEAALYADDNIFAMRTFTGKIKDPSTILRITWKLTF